MAGLLTNTKLGNTGVSSLIKSAQSLQNQLQGYNDSLAAYQYELSAKTDEDFSQYQTYLQGRITNLSTTGSVTDASKALTLTKTLTSAVHSNVSSNIQRENIQMMSGNANLQDKYNTVVDQFSRAMAIGDLSLGQSLENQAYSISQQIQYQAQQAASASQALAKAATESKIYAQQGIASSLDEANKQLTNDISHVGIDQHDKVTAAWVAANTSALQSLGVIIPKGAQPNYWDIVNGIQAAKYNALVLEAQTKAPTDPKGAQALIYQAHNLQYGATKIDTLGGSLTIQQIQQASQDPSMFAFDSSTGKMVKTAQIGYQYVDGQLAPQFSGIAGDNNRNKTIFLNPNQTAELTALGLNFSMNKNGTSGDGVRVQATENTPQWLKDTIGTNGITNVFTDKQGNLQFAGQAKDGLAYFSLMQVGGLYGMFEHAADGSSRLTGGNYGFDQGAAQLLINAGQQRQYQIQLQTQAEQAAQASQLKLMQPMQVPQLQVQAPKTQPVATKSIQPTITTQSIQPTFNPQQTANPQPKTVSPQTTTNGFNLNTSGSGGIRLR